MTTTALPPGPSQRRTFAAGARAMSPLLAGIVPFGLVIGVTVAGSGLPRLAGLATGWLIYAGSAQLAVIGLLGAGAAPAVVIAAVLAINARLSLYAGTMAPQWRGASRAWRALAAYLLVDPSFAVGTDGYAKRGPTAAGHAHYLGGAVLLWLAWQLAIAAGMTLGSVVPASLGLDLVVPLYLIAMVMPKLTTGPIRFAALAAAGAAAAGTVLPLHLGSAMGIVGGLAAGVWFGRVTR